MNSSRGRPSDDPPAAAAPPAWEYQCRRCGNCCRWPGDVRIEAADITRIAGRLGVTEEAFIARFTRLNRHRTGLSLEEVSGGACVFFRDGGCAIHEVKPAQCRDFPNRWRFPGWRSLCEAVPVLRQSPPPPATGREAQKDPCTGGKSG